MTAYLKSLLIFGGIYLLIIVGFAVLYSTKPFNECGSLGIWDALYFSAVTITTLGYGDIHPTLPWGKGLAAAESVLGVLFVGAFFVWLADKLANGAEQKRIQSQKDKLTGHYRAYKRNIIAIFVEILSNNEILNQTTRAEIDDLNKTLQDIDEYIDFMQNNHDHAHTLTLPGVIDKMTSFDISMVTERFAERLNMSLNSIPYEDETASVWMTKLQEDLSFLERNSTNKVTYVCLLYTSPSPRDRTRSRMPSSA